MRTKGRGLVLAGVLVECLLCFFVVGSSALLGLLLVPMWIGMVVNYDAALVAPQNEGMRYYPLLTAAQVLLGVIGLIGIARVAYIAVKGTADRHWRTLTLMAVAAGMISVVSFLSVVGWVNVFNEPFILLSHFILPIGGALHLMYMARRALF